MPQAFDGFSFDLFGFMRRPSTRKAESKREEVAQSGDQNAVSDERFRRQQDQVAFWGLVAFPIL